jgi:hypothetical protein
VARSRWCSCRAGPARRCCSSPCARRCD